MRTGHVPGAPVSKSLSQILMRRCNECGLAKASASQSHMIPGPKPGVFVYCGYMRVIPIAHDGPSDFGIRG